MAIAVLAASICVLLVAIVESRRLVRRSNAAKRETENLYRSLVDNLPMVASVFAPDGTLTVTNPAQLLTVTGYTPREIASAEAWRAIVHPEDLPAATRAIERTFAGETVRLLGRFRHRDGTWRWGGTVFYPRKEGNRITAVNALTSDVSDRRKLEDQLRHAQKMEALGAMCGGIAHDFNNLLSSILGNIELASRRLAEDHPGRKNLDDAARTALRASEHTRQLLRFSRHAVENPRLVGLNDVCNEAVEMVRPTVDPRIQLTVRGQVGLWEIAGDPGELVQVLVNLLLNARDVLPEGGEVVVETANVVVDETYTRLHAEARPGEFVCVTVSDDGPGMPATVRARIFEPFFTTKPPGRGTGLGLAMVYGTVRSHGGWIGCYSEPGRGTRFAAYLPRATRSIDWPAPAQLHGDIPRGSETLLLVDDDRDLLTVGVQALGELGYTVLVSRDGVEALRVFEAERHRIRLVVLDLSMPRLSGRDTLIRLRQIDPAVRVLLTSGHSLDGETRRLLDQAFGFVEKPFRLAAIGRAVRAALDAPPLARTTAPPDDGVRSS